MTWTYDPGALATSATYQVRFLIGDVLSSDPQVQDEEISFAIGQRSTIYGAAAECCRSLAAKFARSVDMQAGQSASKFSQLSSGYTAKANEFEAKAAMGGAGLPYAGGISITDKQRQENDTDRVPPQFKIGMDETLLPIAPVSGETNITPDEVGA